MQYPDCPACKQGMSWDGTTEHVSGCPENLDELLAKARETHRECTDGGDDEHFTGLVLLGHCPYCGVEAA